MGWVSGGSRELSVAVDVGTLAPSMAGIGRYLSAVLPRMIALSGGEARWLLYGRHPEQLESWAIGDFVGRHDGLPHHAGRIASLFSSLPWWAWRDRPDVFWGPAHRLPVALPATTACVVTIHDLCWVRAPQTMQAVTRELDRRLMARAVRRADTVIAVSRATADDLHAVFPETRDKTVVIHAGFTLLTQTLPLEELVPGIRPGRYLLFVGTLEPRKNLARLMEAYAQAARQAPEIPPLVVVGGRGWGGEDPASLIRHLRLDGRVHVLGRVPDGKLATLYENALCLVMPSLYEGFGLPLVEAMSFGTPVLTSSVSSMPEVVGDAGLLVDPLSVESITAGLLAMVNDVVLRETLASRAALRAAQFTWERAASETLDVLQRAGRRVARQRS